MTEEQQELFDERAAIIEYDGELCRKTAELMARSEIFLKKDSYKLKI